MILHSENLKAGKVFDACHGFNVCMGMRYLGGYTKDDKYKHDWLRERMMMREKNIGMISETAGKYPQESYAMVVRALQSE